MQAMAWWWQKANQHKSEVGHNQLVFFHIPGSYDQWQHLRQLSAGAKVPGLHWIPHHFLTSHLQGNY